MYFTPMKFCLYIGSSKFSSRLMECLVEFGNLSGYKVNVNKTGAFVFELPFYIPDECIISVQVAQGRY